MLNFSWVPVLLPAPLAALAIYFVMGWRLRRSIGLWAWPIGYLLATPLFFLPTAMLALNTRAIALNQTLQPAETVALRTWFPHPFIQYSSSSEGNVLLVRKNDFSEALVEYARTNRAN